MARCRSTVRKLKIVDSWPRCWVADPVNTEPTLPTSFPWAQSAPVWSRKFFICAAMLPKRVGEDDRVAIGEFVDGRDRRGLVDLVMRRGRDLRQPTRSHCLR